MARKRRATLFFFGFFFVLTFGLSASQAQLPSPQNSAVDYKEFYEKHSPSGVSLVFSTHYLNNPASAFGHTFLRIHRKEGSSPLLDQGINFSAELNSNDNALVYTYKGLFGGYPGKFASLPYFYKVREYNDLESRDLWEYNLELTPEELDLLVRKIWELRPHNFNYYYLSENCSYQILALIEAAAPRFKLMKRLHSIVIPVDTIHALMDEPGLVKSIHFEPSLRRQLETRFNHLSDLERDLFWALIENQFIDFSSLKTSPPASAVAVLDAANDWLDTKFYRRLVAEDPGAVELKNRLRIARSQIKIPSPDLVVPTDPHEAPHFGHKSNRLGLMGGRNRDGKFIQTLEFRFAYHDLMDPSDGFSKDAQIEMGKLQLRHSSRKFHLDEATLIRILSLNPWSELSKGVSWSLDVGGQRSKNPNCVGCTEWGARGGTGFSFRPLTPVTGLFLLEAQGVLVPYASVSSTVGQAGLSPRFELFLEPVPRFKLGAFWNWTRRFPKPAETYWNSTIIARTAVLQNLALDFQWGRNRVESTLTGGAYFYF